MSLYTIPGVPNDAFTAGGEPKFRRLQVDQGQTGFFEGVEFRVARKIVVTAGAPVTWKFSSLVDFILLEQSLGASIGDIEFYAWRGSNVTPAGTFGTPVPVLGKNISAEYRKRAGGSRYTSQVSLNAGGTITPIDANLYADYDRAKTSNATAQQLSVGGARDSVRYLAAGDFYLQFISTSGTSEGRFSLAWEERPTWP